MPKTLDPSLGPALLPIARAAPWFGITPDLMLSAIEQGQMAIRIERLGRRGVIYVNRLDTLNYLRSITNKELTL